MQVNTTTYDQPTPTTNTRTEELRGGDEVLVYDGRSSCLEWFVVLDAFERDGRTKIRVEGCAFYFDAELTKDCRINHTAEPEETLEIITDEEVETLWYLRHYGHTHVDSNMRRTIY